MIDITNDPTQQMPQDGPEPTNGAGKPDLSRKGFIITYPMFRYWNKESVAEGLKPKPLNLYVHTPYCIQRCAYCYFKTTTLKDNRLQEIDRYVSSVCKEIELVSKYYDLKNRPVETVYFGGGTPTLLTEDNIDKLFSTLRANFSVGDAQITFEGEPVTLTERKAALLKRNGVKRISLGIQSFQEEVVFLTGRRDTEEQTVKAIELAKGTGAEVNIDLISGLPGETPEYWAYSVKRAIESDVHNITIYKLELYANTPFYSADKKKEVTLPSEEEELEFFKYAMAELDKAGYKPVNTFTFAKNGAYDQQNTRSKWEGHDNCAVGVSAFGSLGRWNYQNTSDIKGYTELVENGELPVVRGYNSTSLDLIVRDAVMGIKLVHLNHLRFRRKHGVDLLQACAGELSELEQEGFLTVGPENVSLTDHGIIYGDYVGRILEGSLKKLGGVTSGSRARVLF
jgi:oxygen-independent coproporphyrinogen-3 oxidase